jgi:hypothetical protein
MTPVQWLISLIFTSAVEKWSETDIMMLPYNKEAVLLATDKYIKQYNPDITRDFQFTRLQNIRLYHLVKKSTTFCVYCGNLRGGDYSVWFDIMNGQCINVAPK